MGREKGGKCRGVAKIAYNAGFVLISAVILLIITHSGHTCLLAVAGLLLKVCPSPLVLYLIQLHIIPYKCGCQWGKIKK